MRGERRSHLMRRIGAWIAIFLLCIAATEAASAAPVSSRSLSDYKRSFWSSDDGAPGNILAITQTSDGYLLLGSIDGLFRFDGVAFTPIAALRDGKLRSDQVNALLTARNGDVWVGYMFGGVAVYRGGRLIDMNDGPPKGNAQQIVQTKDGGIWIAAVGKKRSNLRRYMGGRWREAVAFGLPPNNSVHRLIAARDGSLWVATDHHVFVLRPNSSRFEATDFVASIDAQEESSGFAEDQQGRIWLSDQAGLRQVQPPGKHSATSGVQLGERQPGHTLLVDSSNALWDAGIAQIFRIAQPSDPDSIRDAIKDRVATSDNEKTGPNALTIYEDREKNIWVGTLFGLVSFRPTSFLTDRGLRIDARLTNMILQDKVGGILNVSSEGVFQLRSGAPAKRLATLPVVPLGACEDGRGGAWITFYDRILHFRAGTLHEIPPLPKMKKENAGPCVADTQGRLWLSATKNGVMRWDGSSWSQVPLIPGDPSHFPMNQVATDDGSILMTYAANYIVKVAGGRTIVYKLDDAHSPGLITFIYSQGGDIFAGGNKGLVRIHAGKVQLLSAARFPFLKGLGGLATTRDGSTWLFGGMGIARVSTDRLATCFSDTAAILPARIFGPAAGLVGQPQRFITNSLLSDAEGNVWASTTFGVVRISDATIFDNRVMPPVAVQSLIVDRRTYRPGSDVRLPAGSRDIRIDYTGLSLSDPKAMRFLYRIEGVDRDWVDAGARRQAFYSNLRPGTYRFKVIAANNDGLWNRSGATITLTIPPTFRQTWSFVALCVGAVGLLVWAIYALRLRQATERVRQHEQTRMAERERIARDLHDTLLQSLQGLILRFQSITTRIPHDQAARADMEVALQRADAVVIEGRDSVLDLRTPSTETDFVIMIGGAIAKIAVSQRVSLHSEGRPRRVNLAVAEELKQIIEEAVRNAARHSNGSAIDVVIAFGQKMLSVSISDDGVGIDAEVAVEGRRGHYGLTGMQERAARIKAKFAIARGAEGGTLAEISTPARFAYADRSWLQRIVAAG